ncbi:MAG: hypothetical protein WC443_06780 [Desulfobaccales bacterium]
MDMHPIFRSFDPGLIWFYRITGYAPADFVIGTFVLALLAVVLGNVTVWLALLVGKRHMDRATVEAQKYQDLSMDALASGDRQAYEATNQLANDAFGKTFYTQIAFSGAFLWPICVALAWMQYRFQDLAFPIPFIGLSLGYIGIFILLYIPAYILFKKAKHKLPFFRRIKSALNGYAPKVQHQE